MHIVAIKYVDIIFTSGYANVVQYIIASLLL